MRKPTRTVLAAAALTAPFLTCKESDDAFRKHFLGLSDNVSYFVEQGDPVDASEYHYRITFKPQAIVPDPDFRGEGDDTPLSPENQQ